MSRVEQHVNTIHNNWGAPVEDGSQGEGSATAALNAPSTASKTGKPASKDAIVSALIAQLDTSNTIAKALLKHLAG